MTNASANQTETTKLTQATYDRLVAELEDLTTRGRVEIAQAHRGGPGARRPERERRLPRGQGRPGEDGVAHPPAPGHAQATSRSSTRPARTDGSVSLGSTVTLRYEGDDEDDTQRFFVGSIEERQGDLPVVSPSSPLGQVLIGRSAGRHRRVRGAGRHAQGPHRRRSTADGRRARSARRSGTPTSSTRPRASPTSSSSTSTWSTR